uniref:uncharacterized protein LOC120328445 n=1 Tax=Styela clava TaxID=7725 RepID=UPI0019394112|nr:uncharacterized protein LOC120328445 [Styela clava]
MKLPVLFLVPVVLLLSHNSSAKQIRRHIYGPLKVGEYCQKGYFEIAKGWLEERYCKKCRRGYENNDTEHSNTCTKIQAKSSTQSPKEKYITEEQKFIKEQNRNVSTSTSTPTTKVYKQTKKVPPSPITQTMTPRGVSHEVENHEFGEKNDTKNNERASTKEIDIVCKAQASDYTPYICSIVIVSSIAVAGFVVIFCMYWRSKK